MYESLYPVIFPGSSQIRSTWRPGKESGSLRFCVIAGSVEFSGDVEFVGGIAEGLFCGVLLILAVEARS